jgi:hypothetical protein
MPRCRPISITVLDRPFLRPGSKLWKPTSPLASGFILEAYSLRFFYRRAAYSWPNANRFITRLFATMAQPNKRVHIFTAYLLVVRLSLALPSSARDAPSLSRHPSLLYGAASPDRLALRASVFASPPDFSELPPRIRYPLRAGGQHLVRSGGNDNITEARHS